jgi:hypothetical protein
MPENLSLGQTIEKVLSLPNVSDDVRAYIEIRTQIDGGYCGEWETDPRTDVG